MDVLEILQNHYPADRPVYSLLLDHSRRVRDKALAVARRLDHLSLDFDFIAEAAMLHDIGIGATVAPQIDCHGTLPYVCHGVAGGHLLTAAGWPRHALVCERHVGVGLSRAAIIAQGLPLPLRDMQPVAWEEKIICYADKFFSKNRRGRELPINEVLADLGRFGAQPPARFARWHFQFTGRRIAPHPRLPV